MSAKRKESGNPLLYLFRQEWKFAEGNRHNLVLYMVLFVVAQLIGLFGNPFAFARVVKIVESGRLVRDGIEPVVLPLLSFIVFGGLHWAFHGPARVIESINAFVVRANYRKYLLKGIFTMPISWHVEHHTGDTIDRVEKGTSGLYSFSTGSFAIVYSVVQIIGSYVVLSIFSHTAIVIVPIVALLCGWLMIRFDNVITPQYRGLTRAENQIAEKVSDSISNISTIITLRVEEPVFKSIEKKIEVPRKDFIQNRKLIEGKWTVTSVCISVMQVAVMLGYFLSHQHSLGLVAVSSVYILYSYTQQLGDVFFAFTGMYGDTMIRHAGVMNAEEIARDFKPENFTNHVLPSDWKQLEVENLSFSYHTQDEGDLHLDDVSLKIRRGERIAFVGASGSGKTTVLKVMRDLYHALSLRLLVDGVEIKDGFAGIARAIALVPQCPEIFKSSIRENITLGGDQSDELIKYFTDMACFTEVVANLPSGLESSVKEKGVNLSGGEQQRLALARGLLASDDKDMLLLDEPTSSLDTANEMRIYENIFRSFLGKTIFSSIHRLHLLPKFDRVIVFDGGRIVAEGTFGELLQSSVMFQKLWQKYLVAKSEPNLLTTGELETV